MHFPFRLGGAGVSLLLVMLVGAVVIGHTSSTQAAFPGDNGKIVYAAKVKGGMDLFSVTPNGKRTTQLTKTDLIEVSPAVSPDGTRIAFVGLRSPNAKANIYVMSIKGGNVSRPIQLTDKGGKQPAWSPDGEKIVYTSFGDSGFYQRLWVMRASDGSDKTLVTNVNAFHYSPAWSPAGDRIAYTRSNRSSDDSIQVDVFVVDQNGENERPLTNDSATEADVNWSADGSRIAFQRSEGSGFNSTTELWVIEADGRRLTQLTKNQVEDSEPAFSPNGRRIVFVSVRNGKRGLFSMRPRYGAEVRRLTGSTTESESPDWSVDTR